MKEITAKYPGTCKQCGERFAAGASILFGTGRTICLDCGIVVAQAEQARRDRGLRFIDPQTGSDRVYLMDKPWSAMSSAERQAEIGRAETDAEAYRIEWETERSYRPTYTDRPTRTEAERELSYRMAARYAADLKSLGA